MTKLERAILSVQRVVDAFDPARGMTPNVAVTIADLRLVLDAAILSARRTRRRRSK